MFFTLVFCVLISPSLKKEEDVFDYFGLRRTRLCLKKKFKGQIKNLEKIEYSKPY
jgi:hypothetical protein